MDEERLRALEGWAGYPDRDPQAARLVRELVREVRRLKAAAVPDAVFTAPEMSDDKLQEIASELVKQFNGRKVCANVIHGLPDPVPFRGVLNGITAETVYGVEV